MRWFWMKHAPVVGLIAWSVHLQPNYHATTIPSLKDWSLLCHKHPDLPLCVCWIIEWMTWFWMKHATDAGSICKSAAQLLRYYYPLPIRLIPPSSQNTLKPDRTTCYCYVMLLRCYRSPVTIEVLYVSLVPAWADGLGSVSRHDLHVGHVVTLLLLCKREKNNTGYRKWLPTLNTDTGYHYGQMNGVLGKDSAL